MLGWSLFVLTLSFLTGLAGFSEPVRRNPGLSRAVLAFYAGLFVLGLVLMLFGGAFPA